MRNGFKRGMYKSSRTFACKCCQHVTRDTGQGESTGLCEPCYELAGIDNSVNDAGDEGYLRWADYGDEVMGHVAKLESRGIDVASLGFSYLMPYITLAKAARK
jgi:hypothetical protein